jgi:hypothetical protein
MHNARRLCLACLCSLLLAVPAAAATPPIEPGATQPEAAAAQPFLTPLAVDPRGAEDPLQTFQRWRRTNRVSLPVVPSAWIAHREWTAARNRASSTQTSAPPESDYANVDAAGGVLDYQGEMAIAVNPLNPSQVVAGANTFFPDGSPACQAPSGTTYGTMALYGSADGGASWTYNCAPWPADDTGSVGTAMFGSDPSVAWDGSGNAYAAYMLISQGSRSAASSIVVAKSPDGGLSWQPLGVVVNNLGNASLFDDKDMMAVDATSSGTHSHPGRIYVTWDENNVERVAWSDTGLSGSWTTVVVDPSGQANIGGDLAVGADGAVYAVWNRLLGAGNTQTSEETVFSKSTDGGNTWTSPVVIAVQSLLSFGFNNYPPAQDQRGVNAFASLAVDNDPTSPFFNRLYAAYCDFPAGVTSGTDLNVYVVSSADGGTTWGAPVKVNDDAGVATQFFPWLAVDPDNGSVNLAWYDTRNDPAARRADVFYAVSFDGGETFSANRQITAPSSDFFNGAITYSDCNSTDNSLYNGNQYGDYMGISAGGGKAVAAWTDTRQYFPAYSTGSLVLEDDLATAAITQSPSACELHCSASGPSAATPGSPASFSATAQPLNCGGSVSFDWDFGDGSSHGTGAAVSHAYQIPGQYNWTMIASVDTDSCVRTGSLTVVDPPTITLVRKAGNPFRLVVTGANLQSGIQVLINGSPWPTLKWKNAGKIVIKKGKALKALVPKGTETHLTFTNPDGGVATVDFMW